MSIAIGYFLPTLFLSCVFFAAFSLFPVIEMKETERASERAQESERERERVRKQYCKTTMQ